jgi:hypothetical protein
MSFSARTRHHDVPNALTEAVRRAGPDLIDLTTSNPTTAGLPYDEATILGALGDPRAMRYEPEALGLASARAAVASETGADASRIAITASTSEAYAVLFKILCDPGDEILVPAPSYPLLDFLSAYENVTLVPYPLVYAGRWHVDLDALQRAKTPRTKAIVVVAPNNPTGSYLGADELEAMLDLDLPIVSDEVFASFPLGDAIPEGRVATVARATRGLVFALSGLSKLAALPQMKLGWITVGGAEDRIREAMARLALVLDAYLSVNTPIQHALPAILAARGPTTRAIAARTRANLALLRERVRGSSATVLDVEGGWYAVIRVPETKSDEQWAVELVKDDAVHVHPGYFFDMPRGAHLVLGLLTPEDRFAEGTRRILARISRTAERG